MTKNKVQVWLAATRPRTLPLALSSIGMGSFLAAWQNSFSWIVFLFAALTTVFLQVLSNLANDYGDFVHGADSITREGPSRAVQSGAIPAKTMKIALAIFIMLSLFSGLMLLISALGTKDHLFVVFFALGILAILAAIAYTNGKKPYGYLGLGDVFVLIFFGLLGVLGTYYLHAKNLHWSLIMPAASCGLFATAVLNVNNIRDIKSDEEAGKKSIPVRIGKEKAGYYHGFLLATGFLVSVLFTIIHYHSFWQWLFLFTLPLFILNFIKVKKYSQPAKLDPFLRQLAVSTMLFVVFFGLGLLI